MDKENFLNTKINNITMEQALDNIESMILDENGKYYVVAINVDVVMKIEGDNYLKRITDNADMVVVDGKPLVWISRLYKKPIIEKISGSDLVPLLCERARKKEYSIFILGGKEGVAEQAKKNLENQYPTINICGVYCPSFGFENDEDEIRKINLLISEKNPDILLVCLGCPKQEKYVYNNIEKYNARVSICAGATVDFLAGNVRRAPKWMSNHGLEWFFRFLQEPKRLFKRYFIDDVKIIKLCLKYRGY
jgi:N-acetylglucosaminyldiphosphoundecaprenol N-acetyl-beta-D-mannosaminyltransferase